MNERVTSSFFSSLSPWNHSSMAETESPSSVRKGEALIHLIKFKQSNSSMNRFNFVYFSFDFDWFIGFLCIWQLLFIWELLEALLFSNNLNSRYEIASPSTLFRAFRFRVWSVLPEKRWSFLTDKFRCRVNRSQELINLLKWLTF